MVIALLTDFGTIDHFVGAMKGAMLTIDPDAAIIDITHEIEPQDVRDAAFTLMACYKDFPAGTIFVAVVDPGVGSNRRAIAASSGGYYFVGPDNGIFSFILSDEDKVVELKNPSYFAERVYSTFHGRDIFAPIAAQLSKGVWLEEFGPAIYDPIRFSFSKPIRNADGSLTAEIVHIDRFGDLITNLSENDLPELFHIQIGEKVISKHCRFYGESEVGELITLVGSGGYLEIAANKDSAERLLNAKIGQDLRLTREN